MISPAEVWPELAASRISEGGDHGYEYPGPGHSGSNEFWHLDGETKFPARKTCSDFRNNFDKTVSTGDRGKAGGKIRGEKGCDSDDAASPVKKNPLKPTPEVLASGRKVFGYDCAMCHGEKGDGKGEMVESMKLTMKDWHDPAVLSSMSDGEMYDLIVTGKDKMVGEGDRLPPAKVWALVLYARTFAKK